MKDEAQLEILEQEKEQFEGEEMKLKDYILIASALMFAVVLIMAFVIGFTQEEEILKEIDNKLSFGNTDMYMILLWVNEDYLTYVSNNDNSIKIFKTLKKADEYANSNIESENMRVINISGVI